MNEKESINPEIVRLEQYLSGLKTPSLDKKQKISMKNNLMSKINLVEFGEYNSVVSYLRKLVSQIVLNVANKVLIKERIFVRIENISQRTFFLSRLFDFGKKFASASLVFVMVLGMFSIFNAKPEFVRAGTFTKLEVFTADVHIQRGEEILIPSKDMILQEGDKIITGEEGAAVIRYFDDSITRLAGDTELIINKLFKPTDTQARSYVEISLNNGMVWSRVFNLVGTDSSFVVKANDVSARAKKAAFNTRFTPTELEVEVYSNVVDVCVSETDKTEKVIKGKKAVIELSKVKVEKLEDNDLEMAWVQQNLDSDERDIYETEERILIAKKEGLGLDDSNDVNLNSTLQEKALVLLTFDDIKKQKMELDLAEKRFVSAEIKLKQADLSEEERLEIESVIDDFSAKVSDFYQTVDEVKNVDGKYSRELKIYIDDKLLTIRKGLSISPDKESLELKNVLDDLIISGIEDPEEAAEIKLDQTFDNLADAANLAASGDEEIVGIALQRNNEIVQEIINSIEEVDNLEEEEKIYLINKASGYLEFVDSLDEIKKDQSVFELRAKVSEIKKDLNIASRDSDETEGDIILPVGNSGPYGVDVVGDKPLPVGL